MPLVMKREGSADSPANGGGGARQSAQPPISRETDTVSGYPGRSPGFNDGAAGSAATSRADPILALHGPPALHTGCEPSQVESGGGETALARSMLNEAVGDADLQQRHLPINRVGIKDISHPVRVRDRSAGEQHTIATFNMYVSLPHNFKGTHMSRFVEILHGEREISVESFRDIFTEMTEKLDAKSGHIDMEFPFFVM